MSKKLETVKDVREYCKEQIDEITEEYKDFKPYTLGKLGIMEREKKRAEKYLEILDVLNDFPKIECYECGTDVEFGDRAYCGDCK